MKRLIRVGSRESKLAVIQAKLVVDTIKMYHPELEFEFVTMKTSGDMILDRSLDEVGGKGLFVKELDMGLRSGQIDIAVHSLKDMPMLTPEDLPVLCYDALVAPKNSLGLDMSKPLGCSSARRKLQLEALYPGIRVTGIRGNVLSRLDKLDSGAFSATVLACAGLQRLGLQQRISKVFDVNEMIPAAGQGILAVQGRAGEEHNYLGCADDFEARIAAKAENAFIRRLDGGCSSPIAAFAKINGNELQLHGLYYEEESGRTARGAMTLSVDEAERLGYELAERLLKKVKAGAV
jgi:hydroxymethylbilane synthase